MRYAILSDIHGNLTALEAVLRDMERQDARQVICLGDTVGYGPRPNECCELLRSLSACVVRGNHDVAAVLPGAEQWFTPAAKTCILWTRGRLTPDNREFLATLEDTATAADAHLCHGSLFDPDYYTTTVHDAAASIRQMTLPICLLGHTHYAEWYVAPDRDALPEQTSAPRGGELVLAPGALHLVNPGSVGQPRDGNSQASYAIWDSDAQRIVVHRVSYNVSATQRQMDEAGLPPSMSERLMIGV